MKSRQCCLVLCCVSCLLASAASGAEKWRTARVVPKSDRVRLQTGEQISGSVYDMSWPARVQKIEGQWLWLEDDGGRSVPPVAGWVRKDDVLALDEAQEWANRTLPVQRSAWVYWIRGLYWEQNGESEIARRDYEAALALDPKLADANIRLGKLAVGRTSDAQHSWQKYFEAAAASGADFPQLYYEWAEAYRKAFRTSKSDADHDEAMRYFTEAEKRNPHWSRVYAGRAKLTLAKTLLDRDPDHESLRYAVSQFDQAIQLNPGAVDAYRERADALCHLGKGSLTRARQSALKACQMTEFRQAESLASLARVYSKLNDVDTAQYYQQKAAEYAGDEDRITYLLALDTMQRPNVTSRGIDGIDSPQGSPTRVNPNPEKGFEPQKPKLPADFVPRSRGAWVEP